MNKVKLLYLLGVILIFILASYGTRGIWLPAVAEFLIVHEIPEKADIIIVLNGHQTKNRLDHALALYNQGYAPKILIAGSWELEKETGINLGKVYLRQKGLTEDDVLLENQSRSTEENAIYVSRLLKENNMNSFILVTSPAHTLRARQEFRKVIPKTMHWKTSAEVKDLNVESWWKEIVTAREVFYEYVALLLA